MSRALQGRGFFEAWYSQEAEAYDIAARSSRVWGPPLPFPNEERNAVLLDNPPPLDVVLQAAVTLGEKTTEGQVIQAVAIPWLRFLDEFRRDPNSMHSLDWRAWEELIAAAYKSAGYDVVLTPRSGDKGRDVIATKPGILSVRYFDQVKALGPDKKVTRNQVHEMLGVLCGAPNVSKGIITTTGEFAPGILTNEEITRFMPFRLELRGKDQLLEWLAQIAHSAAPTSVK
jgi:restriction system protein